MGLNAYDYENDYSSYVTPVKYEAPKYEAPKYEAPKYEAPKYEAPKYKETTYPSLYSDKVPTSIGSTDFYYDEDPYYGEIYTAKRGQGYDKSYDSYDYGYPEPW